MAPTAIFLARIQSRQKIFPYIKISPTQLEKRMFESLTPKALDAFVFGRQKSQQWGHPYFGSEHLLIGLANPTLETSIAGAVFRELGLSHAQLEPAIIAITGRAPSLDDEEDRPFTAKARLAIEAAVRTQQHLNHSFLCTGHLLDGLIATADCLAVRVIQQRASSSIEQISRLLQTRWHSALPKDFEYSDHVASRRIQQLAKFGYIALHDPEWRIRLVSEMRTTNITVEDVEEYLAQ